MGHPMNRINIDGSLGWVTFMLIFLWRETMQKIVYWLQKTFSMNWRYCKGFCVTCKYYETCKKDQVLK